MIDNSWVIDIETKVYSIIKALTEAELKAKYPDIHYTMDDATLTKPKFPTVYFHFLQSAERGQDLVGTSINALSMTCQVEITVSKELGLSVAREVSGKILDAFKELKFVATMPEFQNQTADTKRTVMRFTRVIGSGDIL